MLEDELLGKLGDHIVHAADSVVPDIVSTLRRTAPAMIAEERKARTGFEKRLATRWKEPFKLYQMVLTAACEIVSEFDAEHREQAAAEQDFTFEALNRLAVRSCRVAGEVLCLLRGGFADGAHARWRTLHELAVVAFFLQEAGGDTAERYLRYEYIEAYKLAHQMCEHASMIREEPPAADEMQMLKAQRDVLTSEYGPEFAGENGWALAGIRKLNPSFSGSAPPSK